MERNGEARGDWLNDQSRLLDRHVEQMRSRMVLTRTLRKPKDEKVLPIDHLATTPPEPDDEVLSRRVLETAHVLMTRAGNQLGSEERRPGIAHISPHPTLYARLEDKYNYDRLDWSRYRGKKSLFTFELLEVYLDSFDQKTPLLHTTQYMLEDNICGETLYVYHIQGQVFVPDPNPDLQNPSPLPIVPVEQRPTYLVDFSNIAREVNRQEWK